MITNPRVLELQPLISLSCLVDPAYICYNPIRTSIRTGKFGELQKVSLPPSFARNPTRPTLAQSLDPILWQQGNLAIHTQDYFRW